MLKFVSKNLIGCNDKVTGFKIIHGQMQDDFERRTLIGKSNRISQGFDVPVGRSFSKHVFQESHGH